MTGKTCLRNSIFRHDLHQVLKSHLGMMIVGVLIFLVLIPFSTAGIPGDSIFDIATTHEQMKFRFIGQSFVIPVCLALMLYGAVSGFAMFRFVLEKRRTTLYFSLGLSRTKLFLSRFFTGFAGLFLAVVVPMLISYMLNLAALGNYPGMLSCWLFVCVGLLWQASAAYLLGIVACVLAGTLAEALLYYILFSGGMTGVCYGMNQLFLHFVWGNCYGAVSYSGTETLHPGFLEMTSFLNPLLFFWQDAADYSMFYRGLTETKADGFSIRGCILWTVILAVLFVLALTVLKKRKAEQAEMSGQKRMFTVLWMTVPGFVLFCTVWALFADNSRQMAMGLAFFACLLLYLWQAVCMNRQDRRFRHIRNALIQTAVVLVIAAGVCRTANLALQKLPDAGDVASASMSYVGNPSYISRETAGNSTGTYHYMTSDYLYTSKEDIAKVEELHQKLSSLGLQPMQENEKSLSETVVPYDIKISYTLKNGRTKEWYYDRASLQLLEDMLCLEESETVKKGIRRVMSGSQESDGQVNWAQKAYAEGEVYLSDIWYAHPYRLDFDGESRRELLAALAEDISNQTVSQRYFPDKEALGVLFFTSEGESDLESFSWHLGNAVVYVTEEFTNTLAFLEKNGLSYCMEFDGEIESITLIPYAPYAGINGRKNPCSNVFLGYRSESLDDFMIQTDFGDKKPITDAERLRGLTGRLRSTYYMTREGYLAAVKIAGSEKYVYKYLPGSL